MANPTPPSVGAVALVNATALVNDYGGVSAYADGSGAEASAVAGLLQAEDDIVALKAAVGAPAGTLADLETEVGDYTGGGGAEADIATGVVALEATTPVIVSKAFGFADLAEADQDIDVDFDAALPAGAVVIGAGINVTAAFDNVGDTASVEADLGIKSGDRDAFCDGMSLDAIAKVGAISGAAMGTLVGAITPSVNVKPDVNGDTLTKGAAVAYVIYVLAF
jgi:hypothetical protein